MVKVGNLVIADISPKLTGAAGALLPTVLKPERCVFELHDVSTAVARAIARVLQSELPVRAWTFDDDDFETNDAFTLRDFVKNRVMCIPIKQGTPEGAEYELDVINNTHTVMYVKTRQIKMVKGGKGSAAKQPGDLPCDETVDIAFIEPNKYIRIKKLYVATGYGYNFAGFSVASGVANVPLDVDMLNMFEKTGVSSSVSDPRHHRVQFDTNGTINPKKAVVAACGEIVRRLENILEQLYTVRKSGDAHKLTIKGENSTTGNLIMKTACDLYPDITAITFNVDVVNRVMEITLKADEPGEILTAAIKHASAIMKEVAREIMA